MRQLYANWEDLYAADDIDLSIFLITMSLKRTKFLLNSLRFLMTGASHRVHDKSTQ